ncbi:MAG: hypothetical protein IKE24_02825 [Clostridia bacterium]|nr:hypothetical protein [Clostridia bacterium]
MLPTAALRTWLQKNHPRPESQKRNAVSGEGGTLIPPSAAKNRSRPLNASIISQFGVPVYLPEEFENIILQNRQKHEEIISKFLQRRNKRI